MSTWDEVQIGDRVRITHDIVIGSFGSTGGTIWDTEDRYWGETADLSVEVLEKASPKVGDVVQGLPDLPRGSVVRYAERDAEPDHFCFRGQHSWLSSRGGVLISTPDVAYRVEFIAGGAA